MYSLIHTHTHTHTHVYTHVYLFNATVIICILKCVLVVFFVPDNSDLIACMVVSKGGIQAQRFLSVDVYQMSLVEPETKRLGWGVVKFAGLLQVPQRLCVCVSPCDYVCVCVCACACHHKNSTLSSECVCVF